MTKFISVCIPAYNRPEELLRLLKSLDSKHVDTIEIIVCEDCSLKRAEIAKVVQQYILTAPYEMRFIENEKNLGYDRNLKNLITKAQGEYIVFMGDDDTFVPGAFDQLYTFLQENSDLGYVLKSHQLVHKNGQLEPFRYFEGNRRFEPGEETYIALFRKSVFISGFTIKRAYVTSLLVDNFDGTLLFQLYPLAEIALQYPTGYFDLPLTQAIDEGIPYFGSSEVEKKLYTPGTITIENSINFLSGFFKITQYIDGKYHITSTQKIKKDMSKYFYPSLAIQRNKGIREFYRYFKLLNQLKLNCSVYYYLYFFALVFFGKSFCDGIIVRLKKRLGKTPSL